MRKRYSFLDILAINFSGISFLDFPMLKLLFQVGVSRQPVHPRISYLNLSKFGCCHSQMGVVSNILYLTSWVHLFLAAGLITFRTEITYSIFKLFYYDILATFVLQL